MSRRHLILNKDTSSLFPFAVSVSEKHYDRDIFVIYRQTLNFSGNFILSVCQIKLGWKIIWRARVSFLYIFRIFYKCVKICSLFINETMILTMTSYMYYQCCFFFFFKNFRMFFLQLWKTCRTIGINLQY